MRHPDFIYNYRCPNHSVTPRNDLTGDQTSPLQSPILDGVENLRQVGEDVAKILRPAY